MVFFYIGFLTHDFFSFPFFLLYIFLNCFYQFYFLCGFVKVTQVVLIYEFGEVFLIELDFFIVYFFSYYWKIILEKKYVIKLYEVTKIKGHEGNHCMTNTHCIVDYSKSVLFSSFLFLFFVMIFFSNLFLLISSFKIEIVNNLTSKFASFYFVFIWS
jgi:hypothetical protein